MKTKLRIYLLLFCSITLTSQSLANAISDLEIVLSQSGQNRKELEAVLSHYMRDTNKEKSAAARFLIGNMQWHASYVPIQKQHHHSLLDSLTRAADSLYYNCVRECSQDSMNTPKIRAAIAEVRRIFRKENDQRIKEDKLYRPTKVEYDYKTLTASELIEHIDHAFKLREQVNMVKNLSFDGFCEYILPYRSLPEYPLTDLPTTYLNFLGKYFTDIPQDSVTDIVKIYNLTLSRLKQFFPKYPYNESIGYQELFFNGFHDCIPIAQYGASTFRMLGIPSVVEYNVAYKQFQGVHYMCSVLMPDGKWMDFSPESGIPSIQQNNDYNANGSMNVYRLMFAPQKDTPFFLRAKGEYIPEELDNPFIRDVSSRLLSTTSLQLSFHKECDNQLVYLATFSSEWDDGLVPVTWAQIDKKHKKVVFEHVVTGRIYFPIYYTPTGESYGFSNPFYIDLSGKRVSLPAAKKCRPQLYNITRKFPQKPKIRQRSESLIGTVLLASNNPSMNPRDTVAYVSEILQPYFQDIVTDTCKGPYTYYRIKTTQKSPHAHIAEIQFLTDKSFNYDNVCEPSPLPVLQPGDTIRVTSNEVRLLDAPLEKVKWKAEYDDNPQTAPSAYPTINFNLKRPQYVTKIRLMPIHADNGVVPGDLYQLLHWKDDKWEKLGEKTAQYNYLPYQIVKGDLYWLQNLSKGKEELPFVVDKKGQQQFVYYDIMKD